MNTEWVRNFVENYLDIHQCHFIEKHPAYLQVKLSVDVDKDLTNRPYYWTFVERTGTEPETMTMNLIFDSEKAPTDIRGEEIHFGSRRLQQIFHSTKKRGRIVRLYQVPINPIPKYRQHQQPQIKGPIQTLHPWLGINYKIEFLSDKKKDILLSLGINLANGEMKENFLNHLRKIELTPVLPFNVSASRPFLSVREAALQLEEWVLHEINKQDFHWAIEAEARLQEELEQIENYYQSLPHEKSDEGFDEEKNKQDNDIEEKAVEKERRIEEIKWQYSPRVKVMPINFGIFYLNEIKTNNVEYLQ